MRYELRSEDLSWWRGRWGGFTPQIETIAKVGQPASANTNSMESCRDRRALGNARQSAVTRGCSPRLRILARLHTLTQ